MKFYKVKQTMLQSESRSFIKFDLLDFAGKSGYYLFPKLKNGTYTGYMLIYVVICH